MSLQSAIVSAATPKVVTFLAAALLAVSCLAGWSLWRLAGAGARCDTRLSNARLDGNRVVTQLAEDQQAALDVLRRDADAALIAAWAVQPQEEAREVVRWRTRWLAAEPNPPCRVDPSRVEAVNTALRDWGVQ